LTATHPYEYGYHNQNDSADRQAGANMPNASLKRRQVRFEPASEEQLTEWKAGKRPLWRYELMWPDGRWETQGMFDRIEDTAD
jgi:hypothetical protein